MTVASDGIGGDLGSEAGRAAARHSQTRWNIRCEWGPRGLAALGPASDVVIIVDVLSFSTCVEIAVSRGAVVFPFAWTDARASVFARETGAELAGPRGQAGFSLSPASFIDVSVGTRIVLPSPNGAALSRAVGGAVVLAGCLRNATALARAAEAAGRSALILPAGEQWPDGSLRPCVEDWFGAGAIADALTGTRSPEAEAARASFRAARAQLPRALRDCGSGQELIGRGYECDVELAAALDVSTAVPVLRQRADERPGVSRECFERL